MISYHDFNSCEQTRGTDALLEYYENDRINIIEYMLKDPEYLTQVLWQQHGPLAIDNSCQCQMGKCAARSAFSCTQCRNLGRMIDFRNDNYKFSLAYGQFTGKFLNITSKDICKPFLSFDKSFCRYLPLCLNCVMGDSFTISILINWFLQNTSVHINKSFTAFICSNKGFNLIEHYECLNMTFDTVTVKSIVIQLVALLMMLNKVNFSLVNPSINNLGYNIEPVSYKCDGVVISGPITLKLHNFDDSAATFQGNHYFSKNIGLATELEKEIFLADFSKLKLTSDTLQTFLALKHFGYDKYPCVLECYAFMIDLMRNESFANLVRTDRWINHIWHELWVNDNYPKCDDYGLKVLVGIELKVDIVERLWNKIKE